MAGLNIGDLRKQNKLVTRLNVDRRMMEMLVSEKIGTLEVEGVALNMSIKRRHNGDFSKLKGLNKIQQVRGYRNWEEVKDQMDLKVRYCQEEEDNARLKYREMKTVIKAQYKKKKRMNQFRRNIQEICKATKKLWHKENVRIKRKSGI